jgi:hypothetical protein
MSVERDIRYELIARLCPNSTGMKIKIGLNKVQKLGYHIEYYL